MAGLEDAMNYGQKIQQERESAQVSLFGTEEIVKGNGNGGVKLPNIPEWDEKLKLGFEKEALGFFITGHPLDRYATEIKRFASVFTSDFDELSEKTEVRVCGIIVAKKEFITKKGDRMAFLTLEDLHGSVEVVVLAKVFARVSEYLSSEDPLLVTGTIEVGEKNRKLMAEDIVLLRDLAERETKRVNLTFTADRVTEADLESLRDILGRYQGRCPVYLSLDVPDAGIASIRLPDAYSVIPSEELSLEVKRLFGYNAASFE
jgi:DNA polymerase-3 subunit alpha